jgi:hypothetical protein
MRRLAALATAAHLLLLLLLLPLLARPARAEQVLTTYTCTLAELNGCATELAQCTAFPRPWTRGPDRDFQCACWAQAHLCYSDCQGRFPPEFKAQCGAACNASVCQPQLGWAHP